MQLIPGTRLGPYEIVAPLGAGGMGEVYRARDHRLQRDVAIKTLPAAFARDPERRARFETEARAIAALSHPGVLAIHDVGAEGETVFAVMELVEGRTLRETLIDGPLPVSRAVPLAVQIANGLAAAHDRGVIHRDLKPENVVITPEGNAKILDFGLAKRVTPEDEGSQSMAPTQAAGTDPGVVLGTTGYMSPEQVRGAPADARSDVFALGALIYEMLSGRRAFRADTPADTMTAILREDPADLTRLAPDVSPAIGRIIHRCLEKQPAGRFRSAADLAYALDAVSTGSGATAPGGSSSGRVARGLPTFRRVTYRNGFVVNARFTPDGAGVAFSAMWEGRPTETFTSYPGNPAARSLGVPESALLAVSGAGELALSLGYHDRYWMQTSGTLARVALAGGGARPLQKDVGHADWSPDGETLALIRYSEGRCRLEYPAGQLLFETPGWLSHVRVAPDGRRAAFAYHPISGDMGGDVCVVDRTDPLRILIPGMTSISGIAWSVAGDEVWCSGINEQECHGVWGARPDGGRRQIHSTPGRVALHDIGRNGHVLLSVGIRRPGLNVSGDDGARDVDLSWFDSSIVTDLSADGSRVLFFEADEAENPHYACYLRAVDGAPAVRLGDGTATRVSADGGWVISVLNRPSHGLVMYPTGVGEPGAIGFEGIQQIVWAGFHPGGKHILAVGSTPDRPKRLYLLPIEPGPPRLLWDEEIDLDRVIGLPISPDGDRVALQRVSGEHVMFSCAAGALEPIRGLAPDDYVTRFDASGRSLYVTSGAHLQQRVDLLDVASGERTRWRALAPPDPTGITFVGRPVVAADGSRYAYSFMKQMSDLYVVEGLD